MCGRCCDFLLFFLIGYLWFETSMGLVTRFPTLERRLSSFRKFCRAEWNLHQKFFGCLHWKSTLFLISYPSLRNQYHRIMSTLVRTSDPTLKMNKYMNKNKTSPTVSTSPWRSVALSDRNNILQLFSPKRTMPFLLERVTVWKPCVRGDAIRKCACVLLFPECSVFSRSKSLPRLGFHLPAIPCVNQRGL